MTDRSTRTYTSVWYFVAATFIFAAPNLFFRSGMPWVLPVALVLGALVLVAGIVVLGRELTRDRDARAAAAPAGMPAAPAPAPDPAAGVMLGLGLGATAAASIAVVGCILVAALQLPAAIEIAIVVASILLLAGAGAMIAAAVHRGRVTPSA